MYAVRTRRLTFRFSILDILDFFEEEQHFSVRSTELHRREAG